MLRRSIRALVTATLAAGVAAGAGAGSAAAAPAGSWSGPGHPVPGAFTDESPALSAVTFPGPIGQAVLVAWRGRGAAGPVRYRFRSPSFRTGAWSAVGTVPGASTSSAPAVASYRDPSGRLAVLAVWTGRADHHIWYSQGRALVTGAIAWARPAVLPASVRYTSTIDGPAVLFPAHSDAVIVTWRGPASHVRYVVGRPRGRGFVWSASRAIPGSPAPGTRCTLFPCTSATPAITEESTGTARGVVYVFWKQLGGTGVYYAAARDPLTASRGRLAWSAPARVAGAATSAGPAASALGVNGFGPVLLVYKAPATVAVRYQTLAGGSWSTVARVPGARTGVAPALLRGLLATTTPTTIGNIILRVYR